MDDKKDYGYLRSISDPNWDLQYCPLDRNRLRYLAETINPIQLSRVILLQMACNLLHECESYTEEGSYVMGDLQIKFVSEEFRQFAKSNCLYTLDDSTQVIIEYKGLPFEIGFGENYFSLNPSQSVGKSTDMFYELTLDPIIRFCETDYLVIGSLEHFYDIFKDEQNSILPNGEQSSSFVLSKLLIASEGTNKSKCLKVNIGGLSGIAKYREAILSSVFKKPSKVEFEIS